jgi:hypothetical protein
MKNRMRKKYQKNLASALKGVNRDIKRDELWLGRFEIRQGGTHFLKWDDNSGGILYCGMRVFDKATGYYKDYRFEYYGKNCNWKLWEIMNKFITVDCAVWRSEDPRECVHDYRKTGVPQKLLRGVDNYHLSEEYFDRLGEV